MLTIIPNGYRPFFSLSFLSCFLMIRDRTRLCVKVVRPVGRSTCDALMIGPVPYIVGQGVSCSAVIRFSRRGGEKSMEFDRWMKLVALERECDEIAEELLKTMGRAQAVLMDINRLLKQDSDQLTA